MPAGRRAGAKCKLVLLYDLGWNIFVAVRQACSVAGGRRLLCRNSGDAVNERGVFGLHKLIELKCRLASSFRPGYRNGDREKAARQAAPAQDRRRAAELQPEANTKYDSHQGNFWVWEIANAHDDDFRPAKNHELKRVQNSCFGSDKYGR